MMTIREALAEGSAVLAASGADTPGLDASLLLAEALHVSRSSLLAAPPDPLPGEALARFKRFLERRRAGECVACILGRKEFRGLDFTVSPAVLVPRPDTETLVEAALEWIDRRGNGGEPVKALDLCTGSGAVAVALKHERPGIAVWASDISPAALEIAAINVQRLLTPVTLLRGDLFDALSSRLPDAAGIFPPERFDLITANPPYVPAEMIKTLPVEVRAEPVLALDGGPDGLDLIRRIITGARDRLNPGGLLVMEADPGQMAAIADLLAARGYGTAVLYRDLSGKNRVIGAAG